ncbi:hypothetical protein ACFWAK_37095, partial [Streptomyces sp. NPDC059918]|uniref:hypothetical protein n=1 Tax=Streptomyces sp. NPDC059918 TaxID=3347003 RepID=UPI00364827D8
MTGLTPERLRRMHAFAEQLAELAERQEDRWKVETTSGGIVLTMTSPTAAHGLNVMRLRRQIEARTPEVMVLNNEERLSRSASASNGPVNAKSPVPDTRYGAFHNDCSAASYSPTGSP